jgi:tripartite-type tricarboxylate transporter receptor subunit TctC
MNSISTEKERSMSIARKLCTLGAAIAVTAMAGMAAAQTFPSKPITIIVPFPPGGVTDPVARMVGQRMSENVRQPVLVENKPGASGIIAAEFVKKSPPDGYTIFFGFTGSQSVNPSLYSKLPYDPEKDFQPVTAIINTKHILVVPANSPAKSVADLVAMAKTSATGLNYASQGVGAGGHLLGEMLKMKTGTNLSHIAYKGSAPAVTDIVAGRVDLLFDAVVTSLPFVKDGRLRALAIAATARSALLPDVPTMAEAGFPGVDGDQWFGMFVPAGTPAAVVRRLNEEFIRAVRSPDILKSLTDRGLDVFTNTPEEFTALIRADAIRLGRVVRESGTRVD